MVIIMTLNDITICRLIDAIIDYKKQRRYPKSSTEKIEELYFETIEKMCIGNREALQEATVRIINDQTEYLNSEEVRIRLECAGIWCNEPIYLQVLRVRCFLSMNTAEDIAYLKKVIDNALFHNSAKNYMQIIDKEHAVTSFFNEICSSDKTCDKKLHHMVSFIIDSPQSCQTVSSVIAYVYLRKTLKTKGKVERRYLNIYTVATNLSEIQLDGLHLWVCNNTEQTFKKLICALRESGLAELYNIMNSYYSELSICIQNSGRSYKEYCSTPPENFLNLTQEYNKNLFDCIQMTDYEEKLTSYLQSIQT